jgi:hypothetical protein
MPITLVVNNLPFEYPVSGDSPGWGQSATDWAQQVTIALANLQGLTDIPEKTFTISNGVGSPTNIAGLSFNTGLVRAAVINYSVYRTSTVGLVTTDYAESGEMTIVYQNLAAPGTKWNVVQGPVVGSAGVSFSVTDAGQFQYTSSTLAGTTTGVIHFRAKSLGQ